MESKNIKQLLDQLIDRLTVYRKKHVIIADVHSKYELEKRIEDLETKIKFLRELPLEEQNKVSREELEKLLASLPLNFNEFEWQKFESAGININITINQIEEKKTNKILTKLPYNEKFEGRKKELSELKEKIATHKSISLISINGIGGIGKSALSKAFFLENYKEYDFALFLEGKSTVYDTFNDYTLLDNLEIAEKVNSIPYQIPNRNETVFGIIKSALSNLEGKKLLLIDDASENSHLLKDLIQSDWEILTTSRQKIDFMYSFELLQATPEDAVAIFCVYYEKTIENLSQEEKAQIQRLVNRLALHPLAIELVAKNIKRKDWTFEETNQKLAEKRLNIDEKTNLTTTHSQEKIKDIFKYLLQLFPLENLTEEELKLLNIYSVLPNLPITKQTWKTLLGEDEDHWQELSTGLNERGLINKNGKAFEIHALLAEIVRYKNQERLDDDCERIINNLTNELHPENPHYHKENYKYSVLYGYYAESILKYSKSKQLIISYLLDRLGNLYEELGNLDKSLRFYEKAVIIDEKLLEEGQVTSQSLFDLSTSYERMGSINLELKNLDTALFFFNKRHKLSEQLVKDYPTDNNFKIHLALSHQWLGEFYLRIEEFEKSLDFFSNMRFILDICAKIYNNNIYIKEGLVICEKKIGEVNAKLGKLDIAFESAHNFNQEAEKLQMNNQSGLNTDIDFAESFKQLGILSQNKGMFKEAIQYFIKHNNLIKNLYAKYSNNINISYSLSVSFALLGDAYLQLGEVSKALDYYIEDSKISEALFEKNKTNKFVINLNISYEKLILSYTMLGDLDSALHYTQKIRPEEE